MADEKPEQQALAEKAQRQKDATSEAPAHPPTDDHANEGMVSTPFEDQAPSGAFDAEGHRPVLERSRKVR